MKNGKEGTSIQNMLALQEIIDKFRQKHLIFPHVGSREETSVALRDLMTEAEKLEVDLVDDDKAEFYLRLGKTCNACENPPVETESYLMKAAKLSKSSVDAWNELGEYYWNKGDVQSAKTIFAAALEKQRNKVSLRNMSTIYRHLSPTSDEEYLENMNSSLKFGKEAIALDMADGKSWSTLGNAYLSLYACTQDSSSLRSSINAYKQAEKDPNCAKDPEFALNYGNILRISEMYQEAIDWYEIAESLSPNWKMVEGKAESLFRSLKVVEESAVSKGRLKPKKIQSMLNTMNSKDGEALLKQGYEAAILDSLEVGVNTKKALTGYTVADVPMESGIPRCLVLVADPSHTVAVNIYNVAKELPVKIGDRVTVLDPDFKEISATRGRQTVKFPSVRVEDPRKIFLNGKPIMKQFIVPCQIKSRRTDGQSDVR